MNVKRMNKVQVLENYEHAKDVLQSFGVDVDFAITRADRIPVSMHCWQGDDFHGFENSGALTGGIAVTGHYPGCPETPDQLRRDIEFALGLIPGKTKLNIHSSYAEKQGRKIDRDSYTFDEFRGWADWAKEHNLGLDFNPTFFSHSKMDGNYSLSSEKPDVRRFWIEHGKRCREIGYALGRYLDTPCVVNFWMPDGFKDIPAERAHYRERMAESLDEVFLEQYPEKYEIDAIESKLFGFGIESYTVASHEFSLGYAITRKKAYCIDMGHFHPTEDISDKLSAVLQYLDHVLLHTSRGVRWDSDHVVIWDDAIQNVFREMIVNGYENRILVAQDYFDGSMNRIACWGIAMRNTRRAILRACLAPYGEIIDAERKGDLTSRLVRMEESKFLPYEAIWDYYCLQKDIPVGLEWLTAVKAYERDVLSARRS